MKEEIKEVEIETVYDLLNIEGSITTETINQAAGILRKISNSL